MLSVIRVVLRAEKSVLMNPGPRTTLRPRLPRWALGPELCGTPNTNCPGAQKSVFFGSLWASLQTLLLNQNAGSPIFCIAPRRSGRTVASPVNALLADRKSTRLNSSHLVISYAVFCLKKKTQTHTDMDSS